jgi:LuxR family maltose regulon positive regulatory protein
VHSFTGSNRYVLDYLMDEVFRQQSPETQAFLLQTSILDRLTASLCDAVTGRSDGRERLLALEQANLFLLPLDQSRTWYRYHHLFADVLRHRLQIEVGREAAGLHGRASRWYAENRFPIDAIHHALAAADWEAAANLILGTHSEMMKRGEVVTLLGWFRALPEEVVHAHPQLCLGFSWPLIMSEQIDAAESCLAHAEQAGHEDPAFLGGAAAARAYIARARGDGRRAVELSRQALALLPQDDFTSRSVVAANLGMAYWYAGHLAEAEQVLTEAREAARRSGNSYAGGGAQFFLAKVQAARGRLQRAVDLNREVIEQGGHMPVVGVAHADLARLLYERDDLAAAEGQVRQGLELSRRVADTEFQIANLRTLALVRQAQGDVPAAQQALQECAELAKHPGISPPARLHALAYQALVALARGDLGAVSGLLGRAPPLEAIGSFPDYLLLSLAQARLLLAQGQRTAAADLLAARHERAAQAGFVSGVMETRALQALAAPSAEEAFACLAEALALAEPEGYARTFLDLGEPMKELLSAFRDRGAAGPAVQAYAGKLLAAFSPPGVQPQAGSAAAGAAGRPGSTLIEPLSERELEVLDLLAGGQTNYEIARALSVSINTVKTHLANIYGKLGVHDRRRAVARGEELGLLA